MERIKKNIGNIMHSQKHNEYAMLGHVTQSVVSPISDPGVVSLIQARPHIRGV